MEERGNQIGSMGNLFSIGQKTNTWKCIKWSAVPLPCSTFISIFSWFSSWEAGQRPRQGTKSCRIGRFSVRPFVHPSVCLFVCSPLWTIQPGLRLSQPGLKPSQPGLKPSQPDVKPSQPGLPEAWVPKGQPARPDMPKGQPARPDIPKGQPARPED